MLDRLLNDITCLNWPAQDWEKELHLFNRDPSNRMQPISKGDQSGAITKVNVPIYEWMRYEKKRCFVSLQNQSFLYSFEGGDRVWWYITLLKEQHKKAARKKGRVSCNGDWIKQWLHCWRLWWAWWQKVEGSDWLGGYGPYTAWEK